MEQVLGKTLAALKEIWTQVGLEKEEIDQEQLVSPPIHIPLDPSL